LASSRRRYVSDDDKPIKEGVSGRFVLCHPVPEDPEIVEKVHRASCLLKTRPHCHTCPNSRFTLFFEVQEKKIEQVMCPRWKSIADLHRGEQPETYVITELATCKEMPFPFCGSCPSVEELAELHIDKSKYGWLSRWKRFTKEADDDTD
jgi:ssDNA-binding Zn-finger/Zn-ribbon topoisomerase 1